jgi:hypothetical protein
MPAQQGTLPRFDRTVCKLLLTDAVDVVVISDRGPRGLDRCRNRKQHRRARAVNGRDERELVLNRCQRSVRLSSETLRECGHPGTAAQCQLRTLARLLDHFVGGRDKIGRKRKPEDVGGAEIDDEIELR